MNKYPGPECGLSEDEWELEQIVDQIRSVSTLEAIGILRKIRNKFAKTHIKNALQAAAEKALVHQKCNQYHSGEEMWSDKSGEVFVTVRNENSYDEHHCITVDKDSILNAYPLTNIDE